MANTKIGRLPGRNWLLRLFIGQSLGLAAMAVFVLVWQTPFSYGEILRNVYHPKNLHFAVQVFLQDFAIAILFVRLKAALGRKGFLFAVVIVAVLFSGSHYPLKLKEGLSFLAATRDVAIDAALVSGIIIVVQRSRDVLWFWCLHFAMDMMQFYSGRPGF